MNIYIGPECGAYYGSSSMPNLATSENRHPTTNEVIGTRDECPDCKARGKVVRRELREVVVR